MLLIGETLLNNVSTCPERLAIADAQRSLSYAELNRESNQLANRLKQKGVKKGDITGILMDNRTEWAVSWYACQKLGSVVLPLHVKMLEQELDRVIRTVGCHTLISEKKYWDKASYLIRNNDIPLSIFVGVEGPDAYEDTILYSDHEAQTTLSPSDPAVILFTSGTTGYSKGVIRTQEMIMLHAITLGLVNDNTKGAEVMLTTAKLYHTGGLLCMYKMLLLKGTLLLPSAIDPETIFCMIQKYRCSQIMALPPVIYERLYHYGGFREQDTSTIREVCLSAGICTRQYADHIFDMFPNCGLRVSWGATETCSVTSMLISKTQFEQTPDLIRSVGRLNPFYELKLVDHDECEVLPGTIGNALIRSPMVFGGYLNLEGQGDSVFTKDGWYRSNDMLRLDVQNNCYYFEGRSCEIIKTGGENVYAAEVEKILEDYSSVMECAVIGIPDQQYGEGIAAAIVLEPDTGLSEKKLLEYCRSRLAHFKVPRYLAVMDALPTNSVGKVTKGKLQENVSKLFHAVN